MSVDSVEQRVLAALKQHKTLPTTASVLALMPRVSERQMLQIRQHNPKVRAAWRDKIVEVTTRLPREKLFDAGTTRIFLHVPEAMDIRRKRILARITDFNGRPSLAHLAKHVAGNASRVGIFEVDPILKSAARDKLIALLKKMTLAEIKAQRLDRNASGEVIMHIKERKKRESVRNKK